MSLKVFFDGGCRPNPGQMESAVFVRGAAHIRENLGFGSNNEAEWLALIHAAETALELGSSDVAFIGDSAVVVDQARGLVKCRSATLAAHFAMFQALAKNFSRVRIRRVGRSQNLAGIALVKLRSGLCGARLPRGGARGTSARTLRRIAMSLDDKIIETPEGPMTWAEWKKKNPVQIPSRRTKGKDLPVKVKRFTDEK